MTESTRFVVEVLLFAGVGTALGLGALLLGALLRPKNPGGLKGEIYECGEPTIGPAWVQFDLRFYVVALVFVVFDVEIALLYPWAVVYKDYIVQGLGSGAFWAMVFFLGLLTSGFLYLWRFGYLDWVRAAAPQEGLKPETRMSKSETSTANRNIEIRISKSETSTNDGSPEIRNGKGGAAPAF